MDLEDFNIACKLPHWAMLVNLANLNIKSFFLVLLWGDLGKITQATIGSIHFPSIHYFALFINGHDEVCHMCALDVCVLKSAVLGDNQYNPCAIVARRLHLNSICGDFFGGIYATRVANYLNVPIHGNDIELPPAHLDYNAMVCHQFLERNELFLQYRLIFDRQCTVHVALPAPTFFNFQAKKWICYNQGGGERV